MLRGFVAILVQAALIVTLLPPLAVAAQADPVPDDLSPVVDNPYFPLAPGSSRRYEGEEFDPDTGETIATRVEERTAPIAAEVAGAPVTDVAVREYADGQLIESTHDYYAQGADQTVYYLGEDVNKYEDGQLVSHDGAWLAGDGANQAGTFLPAAPRVGDRFAQEQAPGVAEDVSTVVAIDLTVTTPAGTFAGCFKTQDLNPLDQSIEHKFYCPDVGLVREEKADGYSELVWYSGG